MKMKYGNILFISVLIDMIRTFGINVSLHSQRINILFG